MSDSSGTTASTGKGTKSRGASKAKSPAMHPKYLEMSVSAINALKERNGSSRQAILKYIMSHYSVGKDNKVVNTHLKMALKRGITSGVLKHAKGQGASGSFRVSGEKKEQVKRPNVRGAKRATGASVAAAERPKKVKTPKAKAVKPAEKKKVAKPKKVKKAKSPKKVVEKKKVAKPKKAKSPAKAAKRPAAKTPSKAKSTKKAKSPKKARK